MALIKGKRDHLPEDAIVLSEQEALKYQFKILKNWKNSSEIFAFKYGSFILGGASLVTGIYLNNFFRFKFRTLHYGRTVSYLPVCVLPSVISAVVHGEAVLPDLILQRENTCPVCLEIRASALQSFIGCVVPFLVAQSATFSIVHKYNTYDLPYLTKEPRKLFNLVKKKLSPIKNILFAIFIGHAVLASVVTYYEAKSIFNVNAKLAKLEYDLEQGNAGVLQ